MLWEVRFMHVSIVQLVNVMEYDCLFWKFDNIFIGFSSLHLHHRNQYNCITFEESWSSSDYLPFLVVFFLFQRLLF